MKKIAKINKYIQKILADENSVDKVLTYCKKHPELASFLLKYVASYEKNNLKEKSVIINSSVSLEKSIQDKIVNILLKNSDTEIPVEISNTLSEPGFVASFSNTLLDGRLSHFQNKLKTHLLNI